ncbi:MAG: 4'-phosphopantetheinyl transferase superfamily protein [Ignavibacteria bacterium]
MQGTSVTDFFKKEIEDLNKVSDEDVSETFLLCWTRKEAFIKAVGDGLSYPLAEFTVSPDKDKPKSPNKKRPERGEVLEVVQY